MEEKKPVQPISFNPDEARREMEEKRIQAEADKLIRERMKLAVGCEEMTRIVSDILVPEFLSLVHTMRKAGYRSEIVSYDAENPIYEDEMCDIGMKFRCGDREAPCKIEFIADPHDFVFNIVVRDPTGEETNHTWSFQSTIPKQIRVLILDFIDNHFLETGYKPKFNDFDEQDECLEGPFKVQIEEDGETSEVASTKTMEEAIKMGASFSKMFKGKPMHIVDKEGVVVC